MTTLLLDHAQRYPLWEPSDLYKFLHQAVLGAEHAISNEEEARQWLTRELASLGDGPEEPLLDPLTPEGSLVRVHLRPWVAQGLPTEPLLEAFFQTAREYQGSAAQLETWLAEAVALAPTLSFEPEVLQHFFAEHAALGFPARHHSERFRQHYRPAYRVIARHSLPLPF